MLKATPRKTVTIDFDKAKAWLDDHNSRGHGCQVCGNKQWAISEEVLEVRSYTGGQMAGGAIYPLFSVMCLTCGNTLLFDARHAGLVEETE